MVIRWRTIRKYLYDAWDSVNEAFGVKVEGTALAIRSPTLILGQNEALEHTFASSADETIDLPVGTKGVRFLATVVNAETYLRYAIDEVCGSSTLIASFTTGGTLEPGVPVERIISNVGTDDTPVVLHLRGVAWNVVIVEIF